jgi:hypothetical protein
LLGVAVVGAPLACGAVHRAVLFPLLGVVAALALVTAALARTRQADFKPQDLDGARGRVHEPPENPLRQLDLGQRHGWRLFR